MKKGNNKIIASVSGVRGIIGDNLTPDVVVKFTSAFAAYCEKTSESRTIVVGYDGRVFGNYLYDLVNSTLSMCGYMVISMGVVPTPTVQIAAEDMKAAGGISITASHNPQIWNGLKFLKANGTFLDKDEMEEVKKIYARGKFKYNDVYNLIQGDESDIWLDYHIAKALANKNNNIDVILSKKFKVVVDAVNAAGSVIVPHLLKKLGCKVIELYCDGKGVFPHTPEPLPENLTMLSEAVKKNKADLGIAVDPDSDRLVLITDTGEPFIEENTIVMCVQQVLKHSKAKKKSVTVNLSTTRAVDDIAKKYGAKVFRSPVGEINVVKEMQKNKSIIGGEGSGGVILPPVSGGHFGRDAIFGIRLVLQELAESGMKLSEYKKTLPQYVIEKSKIENVKNPKAYLEEIVKKSKNEKCKVTTADGVKLDYKDYWLHYRSSNTEPVIRIIKETKVKSE